MDAQELRNLQEAYMDVYNEEYKERPIEKMKSKAMKIVNDPKYKGETGSVWRHQQILKHATKSQKSREAAQRKSQKNIDKSYERENEMEGYDYDDIILSHLLDEGYAETQEQAEVIMVNMSEEWREDIMEKQYGPDEKLPGSGLTPSQKYRIQRKKFKKSKDKTGRQRAERMAQNYYIGTTQSHNNY